MSNETDSSIVTILLSVMILYVNGGKSEHTLLNSVN